MKKGIYENIKQVDALINETYMYAVITVIIALIIAYLIAKFINWGGKNDKSHIKRRIWYIVIGFVVPISFFLYNAFVVSEKITKAPLVSKFSNANLISTISILGIYVIIGIVTMLIFRSSKWGSILGKTK